ncbi:MAG: cation diffusion facilitator family transporter, partial [Bdellovibrionales bacterium]
MSFNVVIINVLTNLYVYWVVLYDEFMHDHNHLINPHDIKSEKALNAGRAALIIVSILIFSKLMAFLFSGSTSVLSTLTDSVADAMMSLTAFISLRMSLKPADKEHRYGHGKIEGLFALVQSVVIALAGMVVAYTAVKTLFNPVPLTDHMLGIGIMVLSILLSLLLVYIQKKALEETKS